MAGIGLAFFFGALEADLFALGVGGACDSVLHLAAEAGHAAGGLGGVGGCGDTGGGVVIVVAVVAVVFATFGLDVGTAGDFQQVVLDLFSFGGGKAVEVVLIVVGMVPD